MKYIFIIGAPGSKWSGVSRSIYYSADVDRSDDLTGRSYKKNNSDNAPLDHVGAYFDPGMEFGRNFDRMDQFSREQNEAEFDRPFSGTGVRIIKSHVFAYHIDYIKKTWPESPVVLVERGDDNCFNWWIECGGFDITYPDYKKYYRDLPTMKKHIKEQNKSIRRACDSYSGQIAINSIFLATLLKISPAVGDEYFRVYKKSQTEVTVI